MPFVEVRKNIEYLDYINNWDLTSLSSPYSSGFLYGCTSLTSLSIDGWKLDDTFVFNTFLSESGVTSLELSNFDLSGSTTMNNMFYTVNIKYFF
mgnify:CR=1 FL=1